MPKPAAKKPESSSESSGNDQNLSQLGAWSEIWHYFADISNSKGKPMDTTSWLVNVLLMFPDLLGFVTVSFQ